MQIGCQRLGYREKLRTLYITKLSKEESQERNPGQPETELERYKEQQKGQGIQQGYTEL
jgi:hypothetical protein